MIRPTAVAVLGFIAATSAGSLAGLLTPALEMPVAACVAFLAGSLYKDAILLPHILVLRDGLCTLQAALAEAVRAKAGR